MGTTPRPKTAQNGQKQNRKRPKKHKMVAQTPQDAKARSSRKRGQARAAQHLQTEVFASFRPHNRNSQCGARTVLRKSAIQRGRSLNNELAFHRARLFSKLSISGF